MSRRPPTQHRAALALLEAGRPVPEVAAELGVPARTVRRWAADLAESGPSPPPPRPPPHMTVVQPAPPSPDDDAPDAATLALAALLQRLQTEPEEVSSADLIRVMATRTAVAEHREEEDPEAEPEEVVEAAVGRGWRLAVRRKLAFALGLSVEEVDTLQSRVIARAMRGQAAPTPERRAEFLLRLRWAQDVTIRSGDCGTLARMLSLEMKLQGLDVPGPSGAEPGARTVLGPDDLAQRREAVRRRLLEGGGR